MDSPSPEQACELVQAANTPLAPKPMKPTFSSFTRGQLANGFLAEQPSEPIPNSPYACNMLASESMEIASSHISIKTCSSSTTLKQDVKNHLAKHVDLAIDKLLMNVEETGGPKQWAQWRPWWVSHTQNVERINCMWEALTELKVAQDMAHAGTRDPIQNPGGWFVDKFCRLAGIQPNSKRLGGR